MNLKLIRGEVSAASETLQFKTETSKILSLLSKNLYRDLSEAVREVISNSRDAHTKKIVSVESSVDVLNIRIIIDKIDETLTICDNGLGMTRQELIDNVGTIAASGTRSFGTDNHPVNSIGQFGVGFYSVFMISDSVKVWSQSYLPDAAAVGFATLGTDSYDIFELDGSQKDLIGGVGTCVIMKVKKEIQKTFLDHAEIEKIILKEHMFLSGKLTIETKSDAISDKPEADVVDVKTYPVIDMSTSFEEKENIGKLIFKRTTAPMNIEYFAIQHPISNFSFAVYLYQSPASRPEIGTSEDSSVNSKNNVALFVDGVSVPANRDLILDLSFSQFCDVLVFVEGGNVSLDRSSLGEPALFKAIKRKVETKMWSMLKTLAFDYDESVDKYIQGSEEYPESHKFHDFILEFQPALTRHALVVRGGALKYHELLRFISLKHSAANNNVLISLKKYVSEMPSQQKKIFYIASHSIEGCRAIPVIESLTDSGFDVLCVTDTIDDQYLHTHSKFENFDIHSASKAGLGLESDNAIAGDLLKAEFSPLLKFVQKTYGKKFGFTSTVLSEKTLYSPMVMSAQKEGVSPSIQNLYSQDKTNNGINKHIYAMSNILEFNFNHVLVQKLLALTMSCRDIKTDIVDRTGEEQVDEKKNAARLSRLENIDNAIVKRDDETDEDFEVRKAELKAELSVVPMMKVSKLKLIYPADDEETKLWAAVSDDYLLQQRERFYKQMKVIRMTLDVLIPSAAIASGFHIQSTAEFADAVVAFTGTAFGLKVTSKKDYIEKIPVDADAIAQWKRDKFTVTQEDLDSFDFDSFLAGDLENITRHVPQEDISLKKLDKFDAYDGQDDFADLENAAHAKDADFEFVEVDETL